METKIITIYEVRTYIAIYTGGDALSLSAFPTQPRVGYQYRITIDDAGRIVNIEDMN
jgi:hypothetical protein